MPGKETVAVSKLQIALLGSVSVVYDDVPQDDKVTRMVKALLAFLLIQPRNHPREVLADLFWRDCSAERARNCLSTALWRLRTVLEPDGVRRGTYLVTTPQGEIGFNAKSDYWLDVAVFEEQVRSVLCLPVEVCQPGDIERLERAVQLYSGELLTTYYEDWVLPERERLRLLYLSSLTFLMRYYQRNDLHEQSLAFGRQVIQHDPLREDVHREMMRLYMADGQRAMALQQYEMCRQVLADELGVAPLVETQEVHTEILASGRGRVLPNPKAARATDSGVFGSAVEELEEAMRAFEVAKDHLQRAMQMVERPAEHVERFFQRPHRSR